MLTYHKCGYTDYFKQSIAISNRKGWEFSANVEGFMAPSLKNQPAQPELKLKKLYVFPKETAHGWIGKKKDKLKRIVFHYNVVPEELSQSIPEKGYYEINLNEEDCDYLEQLSKRAVKIIYNLTDITSLEMSALATDLSLMVLRKSNPKPLAHNKNAFIKVEQAVSWYQENVAENPSLENVAKSVHISTSHLRRIFHLVKNESPQSTLNRMRMNYARTLLNNKDENIEIIAMKVGFSTASALSRAIKSFYGLSPKQIREELLNNTEG